MWPNFHGPVNTNIFEKHVLFTFCEHLTYSYTNEFRRTSYEQKLFEQFNKLH